MKMLVLGAGLQGSACAYDLLRDPEVTEVRIADLHVNDLPAFLATALTRYFACGLRPWSMKTAFDTSLSSCVDSGTDFVAWCDPVE